MTAVVKHAYTAPNLAVANPSIAVADTPATGDVMILLVGANVFGAAPSAVTGLGATWTRATGSPSTNAIFDAWVGVGATASGTVTTTAVAGARSLAAFMVAGVTAASEGVHNSGTGPRTTPAQTADYGQVVLGLGFSDSAAGAITDNAPPLGWTENTLGMSADTRFMGTVYRTPLTAESHSTTAQRASSTTYVSQLVLGTAVPRPPRTNLFTHPSAEGADIAWETALGTNTTVVSLDRAWVGASSYKMDTAATGSQEIRTPIGTSGFPVTAGLPYAFSFYAQAATTARATTPKINWYNAAGTFLSTTSGSLISGSNSVWNRASMVATAPASAAYAGAQIRWQSTGGAETQYLDGFLLEQSGLVNNYFDGSTTEIGYTQEWLGTPHASASTSSPTSTVVEIDSAFSGSGNLGTSLAYAKRISSSFSGVGVLSTAWSNYRRLASGLGGSGALSTLLTVTEPATIASNFTGAGTLTTALVLPDRTIDSAFNGQGFLQTALGYTTRINSAFSGEGTLFTELAFSVQAPPRGTTPLGRLASFSVNTSAVPANPAEGSGSTPSVSASYKKGLDPEYALGEANVLKNGAIGTYEGEIVSVTTSEASAVARISMDTLLTPLNVDMHLFPFIDGVPGLWTAARALDYWTQQCGVFYDKVPGDVLAYASGFGHTDSFGASTTARFYERLSGGTTTTQVVNGRSVKTLGSAVTGTTAFHELPEGNVSVSLPANSKLVFSTGLGLLGTGRTTTVRWNFLDSKDAPHAVSLEATSAGVVTAKIGMTTIASAAPATGATYRLVLSLERLSSTALVAKLTIHTDDLAGAGTLVHDGTAAVADYPLPGVMRLTSLEHVSAGGSGAQMTRWGTYLTVADNHPMELPAVQKVLGETKKPFGFVSGFEGNVWNLLNEFCSIAKLDVRFLDAALHVSKRTTAISLPGISWSQFEVTAQRREKYKQVAVVNKQSKAVATDDAVLWRADSVFSVAAREVFETTVQTPHSILNVVQPVAVDGIRPFPYIQGGGQYVVTGADGYIIAPAWWNDNGGKVEVSLTGKEGEIAIKITAPALDTVRAPYRISEGAADRPALYVCGSGILNDPKEVHVNTGAKNAREGFDSVFESPFIAGVRETYDTAAAMAHEYSAGVAEVQYALPNDFETPTGLGQYPAGTLVTDNKRNFRIMDASQTHSKVSGNAVPHTTIGAYVASYPAGATIRDEKARHAGRTIRKFNIKPLKGDA